VHYGTILHFPVPSWKVAKPLHQRGALSSPCNNRDLWIMASYPESSGEDGIEPLERKIAACAILFHNLLTKFMLKSLQCQI
jgi:hypothetical protein